MSSPKRDDKVTALTPPSEPELAPSATQRITTLRSRRIKKSNNAGHNPSRNLSRTETQKGFYTDQQGRRRRIVFVLSEADLEDTSKEYKLADRIKALTEHFKQLLQASQTELTRTQTCDQSQAQSMPEDPLSTSDLGQFSKQEGDPLRTNLMVSKIGEA